MINNNEKIYIVAGGPSLKGYNWSLLRNKRVIAVNRAFEVLPKAEITYFSDKRFFDWFEKPLLAHPSRKITGARIEHPNVENYKFTGARGLDTRPGYLRTGNNSTYAAINLAYHLGARMIIILGLDMRFGDDGATHFHSGYETANMAKSLDKMKPYFASMAEALLDHDIVALNASMHSDVDEFERIPLEAAHRV
jgi:hypothetical protein